MTFPNSGAVSLDAFVTTIDDPGQTTAGDARPHSMSEFYRKTDGPVYDLETTENDDVPANGEIKFSQLRGTRAVVTRSVSSGIFITGPNQFGHVLDNYFTSTERANKACRLIVDQDIYPGETIANADPNNNTTTTIPSFSQPQAADFPHGLYLEFPQNSNGNNVNYIGGTHGSHGSPGTFPNNNSQNANNPNDGGTGGPGFVAACKVYVNPGAIKANNNSESCFRGGGGGGGGGAVFNRGNLGNGQNWNTPNDGAPQKWRFGTSFTDLANTGYYEQGNWAGTPFSFGQWAWDNVNSPGSGVNNLWSGGNVQTPHGYPTNGAQGNYNTPSAAGSGGLRGHGLAGYDGSNSASWSENNTPGLGSAGNTQVWNNPNPISDIYNGSSGYLGTSGSDDPWAHFPYGSGIRNPLPVATGPNSTVAIGVSIHYGYPIAKIVGKYNYYNNNNYAWFHVRNMGGTNSNPSGHFNVLNNAVASTAGTAVAGSFQNATTGTIRPAGSGGSAGVQFNTSGPGAVNSGDVTSVE